MFIIGYNLKKKLSEKAKVQYTAFLFLKERSGTDPFFQKILMTLPLSTLRNVCTVSWFRPTPG